jgi:hypothetical protein
MWNARSSKNPAFEKFKNKYFFSPYSNETFYMKALEYQEYFTHIDLKHILKSLQDFKVFPRNEIPNDRGQG